MVVVAARSGWDHGHVVDQLAEAVRALRAAQAAVPRAEARARESVRQARERVEQARERVAEQVVADYVAGARVAELARRSGYSRETIRRILRAAGIAAD
jgi:outer membrane murein-binding lipoprotein Lpp